MTPCIFHLIIEEIGKIPLIQKVFLSGDQRMEEMISWKVVCDPLGIPSNYRENR